MGVQSYDRTTFSSSNIFFLKQKYYIDWAMHSS